MDSPDNDSLGLVLSLLTRSRPPSQEATPRFPKVTLRLRQDPHHYCATITLAFLVSNPAEETSFQSESKRLACLYQRQARRLPYDQQLPGSCTNPPTRRPHARHQPTFQPNS